jgi:hypothetical protein
MSSEEITAEVQQLDLPPDLLAEVSRRNAPQTDLHVEALKPSLFERLARMLGLD